MNWKELKEFVNSLDEKQLKKKVILWRESEAITAIEPSILEEDQYIDEGDDGCYSLRDAGYTLREAKERKLKKVYDKGTPILHENF